MVDVSIRRTAELCAEAFNILVDAYVLIKDGGWTKGAYARTEEGENVLVTDNRACRFCPIGAVYRADYLRTGSAMGASDAAGVARGALADQARLRMGTATPMDWNDNRCKNGREASEFVADAACAMYNRATVLDVG